MQRSSERVAQAGERPESEGLISKIPGPKKELVLIGGRADAKRVAGIDADGLHGPLVGAQSR